MVTETKIPSSKRKAPSMRHKIAFQEVVKGSSLTKAMLKAGYSPAMAKRTNKLTRTKGWQELVDKYIPEESLMRVHKEGLSATKRSGTGGMKIGIGADGAVNDFGHTEIDEPDYAVRHKYLETGYKLRGRLSDKASATIENVINLNFFNENQLRKVASRAVDGNSTSPEELGGLRDSDES